MQKVGFGSENLHGINHMTSFILLIDLLKVANPKLSKI